MALPLAVPILTTNPVGWAILGVAGYMAYKTGKKAGLNQEETVESKSLTDSTVKGAMKSAYKTKMKIDESLGKSKEKYTEMWDEARSEVQGDA